MSMCIKVKNIQGFKIWSITCPVCKKGNIIYKIRPNGQKEYNLSCKNCRSMGSPDWFEVITETPHGKNLRRNSVCGLFKQLPIC